MQRRFNTDPQEEPLRILIATDAAREGLNFQAHCTDLFHFDLPWNPGRIEQRNGRIDRKLQPASEVRCHYFVLPQRAEDHVLEVLVRKTETIKRELGSLSQGDRRRHRAAAAAPGIRHRTPSSSPTRSSRPTSMPSASESRPRSFEQARERQDDLIEQIERCETLLERSRDWTGFREDAFRDALCCSLGLLGADELREDRDEHDRRVWRFPPLDARERTDPSWAATLDTLRAPRKRDQKLTEWRREAPIRPVVFEDAGVLTDEIVHLHLEQRVAQRLLARFRSQGFIYHDLSRACLAQANDSIPRVLLLGRLSLYGQGAERLHEEIVTLTARWVEPSRRSPTLVPYGREAEAARSSCCRPPCAPQSVPRRRRQPGAGCSKAPPATSASCCRSLRSARVELAPSGARSVCDAAANWKPTVWPRCLNASASGSPRNSPRFREHSAQLDLGLSMGNAASWRPNARPGGRCGSGSSTRELAERARPHPWLLRGTCPPRRAGWPRLPLAGRRTDGQADGATRGSAHLEWLGFVQPTGLVVSAPALVRAGAILDRRDADGQRLLRGCLDGRPTELRASRVL